MRIVVLAAVLAAAVAGCTNNVEVDATLGKPPAVDPLPITMGVHYPPELRGYRRSAGGWQYSWNYSLGPPSVALFDQVFSSMFARIIPVTERPTNLDSASNVAAIIEMRIERFQPYDVASGAYNTFIYTPVEIIYRANLYSPQGHQIATWTVSGSGVFEQEGLRAGPEVLTAVAMRRAAAEFIAGFRQQPEVAGWLAGLGLASAPPLPSQWKFQG